MLGEVSRSKLIGTVKNIRAEDWKDVLTASLRKARVVPGIDAGTFVVLGLHTSKMTKDEFAQLLELI